MRFEERIGALRQPRYQQALAECEAALEAERAAMPAAFKGGGVRGAVESVDAQRPFFAAGGQLARLCEHIDGSARAVLRKMHRHLRELERRSARVAELRAAVERLARLDPAEQPELGALLRTDRRLGARALRRLRGARWTARAAAASAQSHGSDDEPGHPTPAVEEGDARGSARAACAADALLGEWLSAQLAGRRQARLSEPPWPRAAPRSWLDVARARHLQSGARSSECALPSRMRRAPARPIGGRDTGMIAPDCIINEEDEG